MKSYSVRVTRQADGLSVDGIYETFLCQIAGVALTTAPEESIKEIVELDER